MFPAIPPATRALILINVVVFLLQQYAGDLIAQLFALWPLGSGFRPWQLITYAFLHGGVLHIFFNMFALYMFGGALERYWGGRRLVLFYLVCVLTAALTQLAAQYPGGAEAVADAADAAGPVIGRGSVLNPVVFELLYETAKREQIPCTIAAFAARTSTDVDSIHLTRAGIPTGSVSIALRYMHSPVEMVQLDDIDWCARLIAAFAQGLSAETSFAR